MRKLFFSLLFVISFLFLGVGEEYIPSGKASFEEFEYEAESGMLWRYWLFIPSSPSPGMPLVVYLHGRSGKGEDPDVIIENDGFPQYLARGLFDDLDAWVIIPQLPSSSHGWIAEADDLFSLIGNVVETYGIESTNISLTGHSMGGSGVWKYAAKYPENFSRFAPLSGSMEADERALNNLVNAEIWAFVGSEDNVVPPESSIELVSAIEVAGGNAKITVFDGADHFTVPGLAYLDDDIRLLEWLTDSSSL